MKSKHMDQDELPDSTVHADIPHFSIPRKPSCQDRGSLPSSSTPTRHLGNPTPKLIFKPIYSSAQNVPDSSSGGTSPASYSLQRIAHLVKGIESPRASFQMPSPLMAPVRNFLRPSMLSTYRAPLRLRVEDDDDCSPSTSQPTRDPLAVENEGFGHLRDQFQHHHHHHATSTTIVTSGTSSSQPSIKLHIRRTQPEPETIDLEDSSSNDSNASESSAHNNSDSNMGNPYESSPPLSAHNSSSNLSAEEVSSRIGDIIQIKDRIKTKGVTMPKIVDSIDLVDDIEDVILFEEEDDEEDDDGSNNSFSRSTTRTNNSDSQSQDVMADDGQGTLEADGTRRTKRKRKPTKPFMPDMVVPRLKIRRRREMNEADGDASNFSFETVEDKKVDSSTDISIVLQTTRGRGRGRGTGRGRGRPRGSTMRNKVERERPIESPKLEMLTSEERKYETEMKIEADLITQAISPKKSRGRGSRGTRARGTRGRRILKPKKPKTKTKALPDIKVPLQVFEEETRMSADIKPYIPEKNTTITSIVQDEESRASNVSSTSTSAAGKKKFSKDSCEERKPVTAETLFEYRWPPVDANSEMYMLQEQVSDYLGIKSFKRKYPDMTRRIVDMEERDFLRNKKIVSETQCDLGLTALNSSDVVDIMFNDFPEKYEEFRRTAVEKKDREMSKQKQVIVPVVRDRSAEYMRRITKSCAKWNGNMNRERKEERCSSFDLQTGTLNYPTGKFKALPSEATKLGYYPVPVMPGQFSDHYKSYTSAELKYLPLTTVQYGPLLHHSLHAVESEESQSDSDDSTSSDDSSSSSSDDEGTEGKLTENGEDKQNGHASLNNGNKVARICKTCEGDFTSNKNGNPEVLIHCTKCDVPNHPSCLELTLDMLPFIKKYNWQCTECKNCIECNDPADEDKMLFCDLCDRGYHIYCVGLRKVPTGRWHCRVCCVCYSCGSTQPSFEDRTAEWHHEFKKGEKGAKYFMHSLCISCHKLYKKGQYCPSCLKSHVKIDDKHLLECRTCEKWVHRECVKRPLQSMFGFMCDPCDASFRSRTKLPSHVN